MADLHRFAVVDGGPTEQVVQALEHLDRFRREPGRSRTVVVHDTFDWRVHLAGGRLELVTERRSTALVWRDRASGEELGRWSVGKVPAFVWDLPPGPATDRLADVLEMRALRPLVRIESAITTLRLLDDEDKTVARVLVDAAHLTGEHDTALGAVVEVTPLRGYARQADDLAHRLAARDDLRPDATDPIDRALAAAGLDPGGYSSKLRLSLDPAGTAVDAWITVLRALHATMVENLEGTIADVDSEFLHDLRVAVRRSRSVLGEAKQVLPAELLAYLRPELKWLGDLTTPTRDFDVYLLTLPDFVDGLPPERRGDLDQFGTFLGKHQRKAQRAMAAGLTSDRYATLDARWSALLADPAAVLAAAGEPAPFAEAPAPAVAARRIWKAYRRLVHLGRAIDDDSPATDLHELRKDGKRLRYLLECFGSLFPADEVAPLVKELKGLQDVLGEYQDCHVQIESLGDLSQQMLDEGLSDASTLLAMGHLVDQIDRRQHEVRDAFAARFARFDAPAVRHRFRRTFRALAHSLDAPVEAPVGAPDDEPVEATGAVVGSVDDAPVESPGGASPTTTSPEDGS